MCSSWHWAHAHPCASSPTIRLQNVLLLLDGNPELCSDLPPCTPCSPRLPQALAASTLLPAPNAPPGRGTTVGPTECTLLKVHPAARSEFLPFLRLNKNSSCAQPAFPSSTPLSVDVGPPPAGCSEQRRRERGCASTSSSPRSPSPGPRPEVRLWGRTHLTAEKASARGDILGRRGGRAGRKGVKSAGKFFTSSNHQTRASTLLIPPLHSHAHSLPCTLISFHARAVTHRMHSDAPSCTHSYCKRAGGQTMHRL